MSSSSNNNTVPSVAFPVAEFQAGVTACLRSWNALRTAVDSGWGGNESVAKADDLRDNIYNVMNGQTRQPTLEIEDLEDNLAVYMEEEFSVVLEDGSEKQVAQTLFQLYEECMQGNTSLAEQLVQTALNYEQQITAFPVQIQSSEQDDDDDEDEDDAMVDTATNESPTMNITVTPQARQPTEHPAAQFTTAAEYAAHSLFGKPKKPKERKEREAMPEPVMDEDGFTSVTSKRRKPTT